MRVILSAEVQPGSEGGIEQVLVGLIGGLARLTDGDEEYIVVGPREQSEFLVQQLGPNQQLVTPPSPTPDRREMLKNILGPARRPMGRLLRKTRRTLGGPRLDAPPTVRVSDGFYEQLGGDVLHITYPLHFLLTRMRTIFSIYDLQHRHLPEFFSAEHLAWRELVYPVALHHAAATVVDSTWVKHDVAREYRVDRDSIYVAHLAAQTDSCGSVTEKDLADTRHRYGLTTPFALYPALTYQHKNHLGLLDAVASLRDHHDLNINIVCTGKQKLFWPTIKQRLHALKLENRVRFVGFVSPLELKAMYHMARFVIMPTLFEGAGLPALEALREGTPVACSDLPSLREYAGDAAFYFDPRSTHSIAAAIQRLTGDADLRSTLQTLGHGRMARFTWTRTAKTYRAIYRHVAGCQLSAEDVQLLQGARREAA